MIKLTVLYGHPTDAIAFETYYAETHLPLVATMPGIDKTEYTHLGWVMQVWNAPFAGFFCYGEFGKSKGDKHEFHNNTCCEVTLKEK